MQPDDEGGGHRVVKVRLKHVVSDRAYLAQFQYAVETMQTLVEQALVFGKSLYLFELDRGLTANGGIFDREVASRLTAAFPIDSGQMEEWLDVVSSDLERRIGRPYGAEKQATMQRLHAFYRERASAGLLPTEKTYCTNLSNPKGHAAAQMEVNYRNNVHCHFDKYVHRFAKAELAAIARAEHGLGDDDALSRVQQRQLDADARKVTNDLLTSRPTPRCRGIFLPWLDHHRTALMPAAPQAASNASHWRFASQKKYPERWLPFMVFMNRKLEAAGVKLLSPLPQRSSFIPAHVRLDTVGLMDLLVDCDEQHDGALLKASLESLDMPGLGSSPPTKYSLPGLMTRPKKAGELPKVSKAMLYVDLSKLVPPEQTEPVRADAARQSVAFKTAIWRSLTKIDPTNKHAGLEYDDLVFNNVIDTDGYSVSLHYVSRSLHGLTRFNGGFKTLVTSQRAQVKAEKGQGRHLRDVVLIGAEVRAAGDDASVARPREGRSGDRHRRIGQGRIVHCQAATRGERVEGARGRAPTAAERAESREPGGQDGRRPRSVDRDRPRPGRRDAVREVVHDAALRPVPAVEDRRGGASEAVLQAAAVPRASVRRLRRAAIVRGPVRVAGQGRVRRLHDSVRRLGSVAEPEAPAAEPRRRTEAATVLVLHHRSGARALHVVAVPEMQRVGGDQAAEERQWRRRPPPSAVHEPAMPVPLVEPGRPGRAQHPQDRRARAEDGLVAPRLRPRRRMITLDINQVQQQHSGLLPTDAAAEWAGSLERETPILS